MNEAKYDFASEFSRNRMDFHRFRRVRFRLALATLDEIVQKTAEIEISGKRIVYTHGDLYGAKYGTGGLEKLARDKNADIVLFGHTHTTELKYVSEYEKPFYLFNPGSIGSGQGSYGIMTLTEGQEPLFSHGNFL